MPAVQRQGDSDAGGGVANGGVPSVKVNGRPIMISGQPVTPHPPYPKKGRNAHNNGSTVTAGGIPTVRAGGQPVVVTGNADSCGHPRSGGSDNVRAG
jgi:uncharacterized Zn-binding protein involved in type VI secretion